LREVRTCQPDIERYTPYELEHPRMSIFKALIVTKDEAGTQNVDWTTLTESELMDGDVTVRVTHSTINYKDGLVLSGKSGVPRKFPMVAGIDFAGVVESSAHTGFKQGDAVLLNGYGLSETHFGGYAEKARVKGDWLIKLPAGIDAHHAMAIGTAGYTAMLSVLALEKHGLKPSEGPALVTGAAGGVGSVAIAILAKLGWYVIASTGRVEEADYL
jgi:acrylyl-CoA reductase (NADPH)